jgi:hypothetical protein
VRLRWETPKSGDLARTLRALGLSPGDGTVDVVDASTPRIRLLDEGLAIPDVPTLRLGIGSVDAERYAAERGWTIATLPSDDALGAFAWAVEDHESFVLLEPNTEARLAATLARHGEGPAALYVAAAAAIERTRERLSTDGIAASTPSPGPFGQQILIAGGPVSGPHLLVRGT